MKPKWSIYVPIAMLVVSAYWLPGFFPFNWQLQLPIQYDTKNGALRVSTQSLEFPSPGLAHTKHAPQWLSDDKKRSTLEISLEVKAAYQRQDGPARIFTLSLDPALRNFTIGQEGSDLIVRMRHPRTSLNGLPEYEINEVFVSPGWHKINVGITPKSLIIRVDKDHIHTIDLPDRPTAGWSPNYKLALGNELTGNRPWLGEIRKAIVRVNNRSIDYLTPGTLYIPPYYTVDNRNIKMRYHLIPFFSSDWIPNLLWFIPLGWLIAVDRRPHSAIFLAGVLSAGLSTTIELGQLFLPSRTPGMSDLIMNTLGGMLGAWLAQQKFPWQRRINI